MIVDGWRGSTDTTVILPALSTLSRSLPPASATTQASPGSAATEYGWESTRPRYVAPPSGSNACFWHSVGLSMPYRIHLSGLRVCSKVERSTVRVLPFFGLIVSAVARGCRRSRIVQV